MGKLSRQKGHAFEREIAALLTAATGKVFVRQLAETRDGNLGDLVCPIPLAVQCKVGARPPVFDALDEAIAAAKPGDVPVAICRRNAMIGRPKADVVVMRLEDWLVWLE